MPLATLVGEDNPYGGDEYFALYPAPDGCSGHRLCCLILGMGRQAYLDSFDRTNLCRGKWAMLDARRRAAELLGNGKLILLGRKVATAFDLDFKPLTVIADVMMLPHPSGRNRLWNEDGIIGRCRKLITEFIPEMADLVAKEDR